MTSARNTLLDAMAQDDYAFAVHDLLQEVPTPSAPAHIPVLRCVKFWKETELITAEQAAMLQLRLISPQIYYLSIVSVDSSHGTVPP